MWLLWISRVNTENYTRPSGSQLRSCRRNFIQMSTRQYLYITALTISVICEMLSGLRIRTLGLEVLLLVSQSSTTPGCWDLNCHSQVAQVAIPNVPRQHDGSRASLFTLSIDCGHPETSSRTYVFMKNLDGTVGIASTSTTANGPAQPASEIWRWRSGAKAKMLLPLPAGIIDCETHFDLAAHWYIWFITGVQRSCMVRLVESQVPLPVSTNNVNAVAADIAQCMIFRSQALIPSVGFKSMGIGQWTS